VLVGLARALLDLRRLLQQDRRGRRLGDEGERAVVIDRDDDRDDEVVLHLRLGAGVEALAELHDVDAVLTERGTDRRRRIRFAGGNLQLDETSDLLHDAPLGSGFIGPIPLKLQGKSTRVRSDPESLVHYVRVATLFRPVRSRARPAWRVRKY